MSAADVYLMSSTVESFALPVIEAIISGLPVVATPVGVAPELHGLRSLSLTAGFEPVDLAEAINRLMNDYPSVEERIEESRAIRSLFSLEATAERLFEVYLSIT
jgi:glycosyltransferase involved in cell wall biosynthesis